MNELESKIIDELAKRNFTISCAESCTGGLIISSLINIAGASKVIKESYVTYAEEAKIKILGVKEETIKTYNVASLEVAEEMVNGLYNTSKSNVCISTTGYAGGGEKLSTDGLCFYGIKICDKLIVDSFQVSGTRNEVRNKQKDYILEKVLEMIKGI